MGRRIPEVPILKQAEAEFKQNPDWPKSPPEKS